MQQLSVKEINLVNGGIGLKSDIYEKKDIYKDIIIICFPTPPKL